ncbi:hypothetical protein DASC09_027600 [Saccharomycopsis crataegensis]|uniref:Uncharacterized protein n=1 Tax=Saccharomycopsis crataegensis TaxID=43959 RepID=A0AAV5QM70_9ASCO|nr:hypothetical protein DASC09_027600 [Saccharomycopsis crataegensis]
MNKVGLFRLTRQAAFSFKRTQPSITVAWKPQKLQITLVTSKGLYSTVPTKKDDKDQPQLTLRQQKDIQISKNIIQSQVNQHIPGETDQTNTVSSRIPKFPFSKDAVPVLIPRPGVPNPGSSLMSMAKKLKSSTEPELIYEAESHRLYFVFCGAFALVAIIYGLIFLESATNSAWKIYSTNEQDLPEMHNLVMFISRNFVTLLVFAFPIGLAAMFLTVPARLIRRMWYIPIRGNELKNNPVEMVKFTSHPIFPGRPTPIHTMPLSMLNRSYKTKIFTNEGFYLTADKGSFLFLLKEGNKRIPWIADRKGFFWGDGRLFDHLFGKESIEEADLGISYDDKVGAINERVRQESKRLRAEEGVAWQFKEQGKLMRDDLKSLVNIVKNNSKVKSIGGSQTVSSAVSKKNKAQKTRKGKK